MKISEVTSFDRSAAISGGPVVLEKGSRVQVLGPNGIGKTTFLEMVASGTAPGVEINSECQVGYNRQDFHSFVLVKQVLVYQIFCTSKSSTFVPGGLLPAGFPHVRL